MTKLNPSLLGLHPSGSLRGNLTLTGWKGLQVAKRKPVPLDPRTWPQIYHRWLYQDYVYLWASLTDADKQIWATQGVRLHLPGYQAFMRNRLANLPDIAAWWHFDEGLGNLASDSSRNANTGTVYGALWTGGVFASALSFDGVDDYVADLTPTNLPIGDSARSIEFWLLPRAVDVQYLVGWGPLTLNHASALIVHGAGQLYFVGWGNNADSVNMIPPLNTPTHVALTYAEGATAVTFYLNATSKSVDLSAAIPLDTQLGNFVVAQKPDLTGSFAHAIIDEVRVYNRVLSPDEVTRHYERGLP